ncbi:uncharacterized protein [Vulpes vulpes]|uniref:Uncharacterized protein n=1 Tax=Vulpes vulpes TaxID=9627 RepID=A0ABM4YHG4_VULVU
MSEVALPGGTRHKYTGGQEDPGQAGRVPASRTPPHSPEAALTRPTILGSTHIPRCRLAALPHLLPPASSAVPGLTAQSPQGAHALTHLGRIWGSPPARSALRSPGSSSTNALGLFLFLRLPSSPARRRDPGRHRKVSLSHLCSAALGSSEVKESGGPGLPLWPSGHQRSVQRPSPQSQSRPPEPPSSRARRGECEQQRCEWPAAGGSALPLSSSSPSSPGPPPAGPALLRRR